MMDQERIAELEGRLAQAKGVPARDNPHRVGSRTWRAWDNGWRDESWPREHTSTEGGLGKWTVHEWPEHGEGW